MSRRRGRYTRPPSRPQRPKTRRTPLHLHAQQRLPPRARFVAASPPLVLHRSREGQRRLPAPAPTHAHAAAPHASQGPSKEAQTARGDGCARNTGAVRGDPSKRRTVTWVWGGSCDAPGHPAGEGPASRAQNKEGAPPASTIASRQARSVGAAVPVAPGWGKAPVHRGRASPHPEWEGVHPPTPTPTPTRIVPADRTHAHHQGQKAVPRAGQPRASNISRAQETPRIAPADRTTHPPPLAKRGYRAQGPSAPRISRARKRSITGTRAYGASYARRGRTDPALADSSRPAPQAPRCPKRAGLLLPRQHPRRRRRQHPRRLHLSQADDDREAPNETADDDAAARHQRIKF
ncbi:hypothetical protein C8J57DRAFT_1514334 [Mycena rebaudengoi]|nr:hypothetical protein C8J57DRAFT_1514334 [Mycena rebaudengoi]